MAKFERSIETDNNENGKEGSPNDRSSDTVPVTIVDTEFCAKIKDGDEELIKQLYDQYSSVIVYRVKAFIRVVSSSCCDQLQIDPGDILQETFTRFLERRHRLTFDNPKTFLGWMCVTARHLVVDKLRHTTIKQNYDLFWNHTIHTPANPSSDGNLDVLSFFRTLNEEDQKLLFMYYYEGCKSKEISEIVGKTDGWVRNRMYQIRLNLNKFFAESLIMDRSGIE